MTRLTIEAQCAGTVDIDDKLHNEFTRLWSYLLCRREETLRSHASVVRRLADALTTHEILNDARLRPFIVDIPRDTTRVAIPSNLERRYDPIELLREWDQHVALAGMRRRGR
jgi:hypothetical protein